MYMLLVYKSSVIKSLLIPHSYVILLVYKYVNVRKNVSTVCICTPYKCVSTNSFNKNQIVGAVFPCITIWTAVRFLTLQML